jgi:hypothetical protein
MVLHLRSTVQAYCAPVCSQRPHQRKSSPGAPRRLSKESGYPTRPIGLSRLVFGSQTTWFPATDYSRVTFHCQPQKYSLCTYIQLAISVIFDLGLHKSPPDESRSADCDWNGPTHNLRFPVSRTRTMNERRAVLSCFLLSSLYVACIPGYPIKY